jgi:hypothetical protein
MRKHDADMLVHDAEMNKHQAMTNAKMDKAKSNLAILSKSLSATVTEDDLNSAFVEALKKDGLITDTKGFSYSLSKKKFKVNGKKQSNEIHEKYLNLYGTLNGKPMGDNDRIEAEVKR